MSKGIPRAQRTPRSQIWKSLTRITWQNNTTSFILFITLISSWTTPCAPRYQIGSGATVTSHPTKTSPIPNDIPTLPEKSVIIEHGEINMPNLSKVLIAENSKLETPVSELGQFSDIQSETQNSLRSEDHHPEERQILPLATMHVRVETDATTIQSENSFGATEGSTNL